MNFKNYAVLTCLFCFTGLYCMQMCMVKQKKAKQKVVCQQQVAVAIAKTIFDAVRENNYEQVKSMLPFYFSKYNFHYKDRDDSGYTLLHLAAVHSDLRMMSLLMPYVSGLVNAVSEKGWALYSYEFRKNSPGGETPLSIAAKQGKIDMIKYLVKNGADINILSNGDTALHIAIRNFQEAAAITLLQLDASVDIENSSGLVPLMMAIQRNMWNIIFFYLRYKNDLDYPLYKGYTALHVAIIRGADDIMDRLLLLNVDINKLNDSKMSPCIVAASSGSLGVLKKLFGVPNQVPALNVRDKRGRNAFDHAVLSGHFEIADFLLSHGSKLNDVDGIGFTALHKATACQIINAVDYLLRNGAAVDARTGGQMTALHIAALYGDCEIGIKLIEHNADANARTSAAGYECFMPIHVAIKEGRVDFAQMLLQHPTIKQVSQEDLATSLVLACKRGSINVVNQILDDNLLDRQVLNSQLTAKLLDELCIANKPEIIARLVPLCDSAIFDTLSNKTNIFEKMVLGGHYGQAKILLNHGVDVNSVGADGFCLLHKAMQTNNMTALDFLIESNANPNCQDPEGNTPLHQAAKTGDLVIGKMLLDHNANVAAKTWAGMYADYTPLHLAIALGHKDFAHLLLRHPSINQLSREDLYKALVLATQKGMTDVVKLLLSFHMYPAREDEGFVVLGDPLILAVQHHHHELIKLFLNKYSAPHDQAFAAAIATGDSSIVRLFVEAGANLNACDEHGVLLTAKPMDSRVRFYFLNNAPLRDSLLDAAAKGNIDEMQRSLGNSVIAISINARDIRGNTALAHAVINGHAAMVQRLLLLGADPTIENRNHENPIELAVLNNRHDIVALFRHAATPQYLVNRKQCMNQLDHFVEYIRAYDKKLTRCQNGLNIFKHCFNGLHNALISLTALSRTVLALEKGFEVAKKSGYKIATQQSLKSLAFIGVTTWLLHLVSKKVVYPVSSRTLKFCLSFGLKKSADDLWMQKSELYRIANDGQNAVRETPDKNWLSQRLEHLIAVSGSEEVKRQLADCKTLCC